MRLSKITVHTFQETIYDFYHTQGRHMLPWRRTRKPYNILVSEIMLQQTQVERVIPKYTAFLKTFPTSRALAQASNKEVLLAWSGLGYNNRALRLKKTAEIIEQIYKGIFPKDYQTLLKLPGIGPATAGDLLAFAWNIPVPIIETNLRTVYMHHFFSTAESKTSQKISDADILTLITQTLDTTNPREWYWALMDYGSNLKKNGIRNNTQSKHYTKQSAFKGSNREMRSKILSYILAEGPTNEKSIYTKVHAPKKQIRANLHTMQQEGLIRKTSQGYSA